MIRTAIAVAAVLTAGAHAADSCANSLKLSYPAPKAADGWSYRLIANGFTKPRGIAFDNDGGLVVVDSGSGLKHLTFKDDGGNCLTVDKQTTLLKSEDLNHGLAITQDGKTLYASSPEAVYSWSYDSKKVSLSKSNSTIVSNMSNSDHTTRTLLLSRKQPNLLLVSRGSDSNDDSDAERLDSGHSQIRTFDLSKRNDSDPYRFLDGKVLGWGLRNSVGVAEHPSTGGIWSVENSVDELSRHGRDIHQDNPAEEMNFHGYLNGSTEHQGGNYGYPLCYTVWSTQQFPDLGSLKTGDQFPSSSARSLTDSQCNDKYVAPRLAFQAHMAPLDIKFSDNGQQAFVTFHGSWDRNNPVGYHISSIDFSNGEPSATKDSMKGTKDVLTTPDLSKCPDECFRPVGLAWDSKGRLWFSSDATGEIFVLTRDNSSSGGSGGSGGSSDSSDGDDGSGDDGGSAGFKIIPSWVTLGVSVLAIAMSAFLA